MSAPLLEISDFSLEFRGRGGTARVLEAVGLSLRAGEMMGLVGESGSGKSVTAHALLRLLDPGAHITAGQAWFQGIELFHCDSATLRRVRGRGIAMIFQNPRAALNPVVPVGRQIMAAVRRAGGAGDAREAALALMRRVQIADAARRFSALPEELAGGLCQRVMIALALAAGPALLIADEPTTGLDVTTQAVIMALIAETARAAGMATLLITHDLALAGEHCDRIAVMHAGHVVEIADTATILRAPRHPYTRRLRASMPADKTSLSELHPIPGGLPDLRAALPPCRYAARCAQRATDCDAAPLPRIWRDGNFLACRHP